MLCLEPFVEGDAVRWLPCATELDGAGPSPTRCSPCPLVDQAREVGTSEGGPNLLALKG